MRKIKFSSKIIAILIVTIFMGCEKDDNNLDLDSNSNSSVVSKGQSKYNNKNTVVYEYDSETDEEEVLDELYALAVSLDEEEVVFIEDVNGQLQCSIYDTGNSTPPAPYNSPDKYLGNCFADWQSCLLYVVLASSLDDCRGDLCFAANGDVWDAC